MEPCIVYVESLRNVRKRAEKAGLDESFFRSDAQNRAWLSSGLERAIAEHCRGPDGYSAVSIPTGDDEIGDAEIYHVPLSDNLSSLREFRSAIATSLVAEGQRAAAEITAENLYSPEANRALDNLASIAELRNLLVRVEVAVMTNVEADPALLIMVHDQADEAEPTFRDGSEEKLSLLRQEVSKLGTVAPHKRGSSPPTAVPSTDPRRVRKGQAA